MASPIAELAVSRAIMRARPTGEARPVWVPLPGPQTLAYHSQADEVYYGGAAGGGKTDLVIGLAATSHRRSIIFRREYPQFRDIIERARELLAARGHYNANERLWRLDDGRIIEFGSVQHEDDIENYQGRAHDLKAFDELSHFTERQYRFLIGWNRTTVPGQRTRVMAAGNPPTSMEGQWVVRYWAPWLDEHHPHPALPGELRWFAVIDGEDTEVSGPEPLKHDGATLYPRSRTFIPARLGDNPYLMATGYESVLQGLPEPLRSQLLFGDFRAGTEDDPWQIIPTAWVRAAQARWQPDGRPEGSQDAVGVDVARGGKDKTVLSRRWAAWFAPLEKHPGTSTPDGIVVASLVLQALADGGRANIDAIGVGASVYDHCRLQGADVTAVIFSEAAPGLDRSGRLRFVNLRAWAYWALREALDPVQGDGLALPPDSELLADLCAPTWSMRVNGIQVESKEDIIKRLGRSPDCGDAVVLAALSSPPPVVVSVERQPVMQRQPVRMWGRRG